MTMSAETIRSLEAMKEEIELKKVRNRRALEEQGVDYEANQDRVVVSVRRNTFARRRVFWSGKNGGEWVDTIGQATLYSSFGRAQSTVNRRVMNHPDVIGQRLAVECTRLRNLIECEI